MTKLYVVYTSRCNNVVVPNEPFGDWRDEYDYEVHSIHLNKPRPSYHSIEPISIAGDVVPGQEVWIVSIRWSSGDSFGNATGKGEPVWIFRDQASAMLALQALHAQAWADVSMFRFLDDTQETIHIGNPGHGYFERVDRFEINHFIVQE